LGLCFAVYTTHSHRHITDSNPNAEDRFRLIIPLSEPIPATLYPLLWQWAFQVSGCKIDPQTKDESRMFYNPAKASPVAPYEHLIIDGNLLNWHEVIEATEELSVPVEATKTTSDYASWDDLNAELKRCIMRDPTARQNGDGFYHCRARCHVPKSDAGIMFNPATGVVKCQKGCSHAELLWSFGLPEQPNGNGSYFSSRNNTVDDALASLRSLGDGATMYDIEKALRVFCAAVKPIDEIARGIARENAIKILKEHVCSSPARLVDAAMPKTQSELGETQGLTLCDPDLWPEPVDGSALLNEIVALIRRFVSAADHFFDAIALWIVYAHAFDFFDISPLLAITSPEKRCGKTTLLNLFPALAPRPLPTSNITSSALFRTVEKYRPTLLIDEADSFLKNNEELRGILNSGHRKALAYVIRTTGEEYEPRKFATWCPKVIALIGALPDTLEDRALIIRLERKRPTEIKERFRFDRIGELEPLRKRIARLAADLKEEICASDPEIPPEITNDRARDNWRPLLSIADAVGGDWPRLARETARAMASGEPETESKRTLLLRDLKTIFEERRDRLSSEEIVQALVEMEGRPWVEWRNSKPITKTGLARLLAPFKIRPTKCREGNDTSRGYNRSDFEDVFARYLEIETPQPPHGPNSMIYKELQTPQGKSFVAGESSRNFMKTSDVANVADGNAENGREVFEI
jgi:putative DNA primase/helicase